MPAGRKVGFAGGVRSLQAALVHTVQVAMHAPVSHFSSKMFVSRGISLKIVLVSPHRDDAAFSLGLTIGDWLVEGYSVTILNCFTRSVYAPYSDAESLHENDRLSYVTALRSREDSTWAKLYRGALTVVDLRLKDAPLRFRCAADEVLGRPVSSTDKAIAVIQKGLSRSGGNAFVLPLAVGGHVDHATASEASTPAATGSVPCAFYEDLPYAARSGGGEQLADAVVRASMLLGEPLTPVFCTAETEAPSVRIERKRKLVRPYDSQVSDTVMEEIAAFAERYNGRERLWVNPAWRRTFPHTTEAPR